MSCRTTCLNQRSFPVEPSSATRESVYRFGPGRLEPFGYFLVPGNGAGLATAMNTRPAVSTAGGYQRPPPELTFGFPHSFAPSATVLNDHLTRPVLTPSAYTMPSPLPA